MRNSDLGWKPVWWTTIIVTITMTILGNVAHLIERKVNSDAYTNIQTFFRASQPDYYPLYYMITVLIMVFLIVLAFRLIRSSLPENWVVQGIIVGITLFLVIDLHTVVVQLYTTVLTLKAVQGMAVAAFFNKLLNGMILANVYYRFSPKTGKDGNISDR